ncbi:MAG TPA: acylneuraminate cytidylyltransferase [Candidatus Atribacteria bacterium]|nr:acylneuraminate cytidylyltransferase [Candidatus Atribacteria bacterium]
MKKIAFIPARCGSKSIPFKNIKMFCGKPLIYWVTNSLEKSKIIDKIIIATDCKEIANVVESFNFKKASVYWRNPFNAQDSSSTESVMLEYIKQSDLKKNDYFFLVQATSPFTQSKDFDLAFQLLKQQKSDSLLSCARVKRFFWNEDGAPINYNFKKRPRRQDFKGSLVENGAFYINKVGNILKYKNRLSGKIAMYEMPEFTSIELDEPDDWIIAEMFMKKHIINSKKIKRKTKLFAIDVDGVLTDGGMFYSKEGEVLKKFNTRDGMGIELLRKNNIIPVIITKEDSEIVLRRAEKLKIKEVYIGIKDKLNIIEKLKEKYNLEYENIAYIGDDVNDLPVLKKVGLSFAPNDAISEIKQIVNHVTLKKGGEGALREAIDCILSR